jgi:Xaa-Pro aminopeptidase
VVAQMESSGVDVLVLCGENNVAYATGRVARSQEPARAGATRTVAIVTRDDVAFLTPPPLDFEDGAHQVARAVDDYRGAVAIDEWPSLVFRDALAPRAPVDAAPLLTQAKIVKLPNEVERIRAAQRVNERAMDVVRPLAVPGANQTDVTAAFYRAVFELGASGNTVDPIWDLVPRSRAELSYTATGHLPFPTPTTGRTLAKGDVCFTDAGIDLDGWASDVGRTWTIGVDAAHGRSAWNLMRASVISSLAGNTCAAHVSRRSSRARPRPTLPAPRPTPTAVSDRGSRTSMWPTASAPRAPNCRSAALISVPKSRIRSCLRRG